MNDEIEEKVEKGEPFEQQIGVLYAQLQLDCVVELAIAVALDSKKRPNLYRNARTISTLSSLASKVGKDPDWPDFEMRMDYYSPLFGNTNTFNNLRNAMLEAARQYSERVYDTGEEMLRQSFQDKAIVYRAGLLTRAGAATDEAIAKTAQIYGEAEKIFTDPGVATAFGLNPVQKNEEEEDKDATKKWPLEDSPSGDGAVLAAAIAEALPVPSHSKVTAEQFLMLQLVATRGMKTIGRLSNAHDDNEVVQLIKDAYSWQTASLSVQGRVAGTSETRTANSPRLTTNNVIRNQT